MIYAILVGYEYSKTREGLLGIDVDLGKMFEYCTTMMNLSTDNIKVISDTPRTKIPCDQYLCPDSSFLNILESLSSCIKCRDVKILFYYTGHVVNIDKVRYLVLPDSSLFSEQELYRVFASFRNDVEIFEIMDCCYGGALRLPYTLNLPSSGPVYSASIILIASCREYEKSASTDKGSFFTEAVITYFTQQIHSLDLHNIQRDLIRFTESLGQNPQIFLSNLRTTNLWSWVIGPRVCFEEKDS
jgi:hypothetical protein